MPLVSVIMPVFNQAATLRASIESVIAQTYTDWELLVLDDCSSDGSLALLEKLAHSVPKVHFVANTRNLGIAANLNRGVNAANGKYIARLDGDDSMLPERLSNQIRFLESHPAIGILGGGADLVAQDGAYINTIFQPEGHEQIAKVLPVRNPIMHPTVMARTSLLRSNPYKETLRKKQDYELWSRLISKTRFHNLQVPLISYRAEYRKPYLTILYGLYVHTLVAVRLRSFPGLVSAYFQALKTTCVKLRLYTPRSIRPTPASRDKAKK